MINKKIIYPIILAFILLGTGTFYFHWAENWSYVDAFYFSTMTLTTVGYGDLVPTTPTAKIATTVYAIVGIGIMLYLIGTIMRYYAKRHEHYFNKVIGSLHHISPSRFKKILKKNRKKNKK